MNEVKEIEDGTKPSKYEDADIEALFDYISMHIEYITLSRKELREAVRLFGQKRFNQGVREYLKTIEPKYDGLVFPPMEQGR